ncbi:terpene synthase family protein [Herbidospora mongoliensis]|uniref:terpene synthase family protein n=1 Tax=Herbidospora mongoliensis TaxID=688067 RepID=UPI00082F5C5D|nr:terpene synthase family protein [Herbidospora mongoliensis]
MIDAYSAGRVSGLAAGSARDLTACAAAHPTLFPANPFDATLFSAVSLANAFGSPDATVAGLRVANRLSLWIFAVDWLIDHRAEKLSEIDAIVDECLDGTAMSPLTAFLCEIRDEVADTSGLFENELTRMLHAMRLEFVWKTGDELPTFDAYLDNAANFGSTFVNVAHWIRNGVTGVPDLLPASDEVQKVLRLLNDLATHHRDVSWGDLNALMLGPTPDEVRAHIEVLVGNAKKLNGPQRDYLARQIGYSSGFYGVADYWGSR